MTSPRNFYDQVYRGDQYSPSDKAEQHAFYPMLATFLEKQQLLDKRCLEVGSGRGAFQHLVPDYFGLDLAESAARYLTKPFAVASAANLPFDSGTFDVIWTVAVLEHIPQPEKVLAEMWRVLRPGGFLFLAPAWQCRTWAADGYPVRPYSDFDFKGKLVKASIPLRNSVVYRSLKIFPTRLIRLGMWQARRKPVPFHYRELKANFETFWMPDSDAVNSMDPFDAYLWYVSRGGQCTNYPSLLKAFFVRTGPVILCKVNS